LDNSTAFSTQYNVKLAYKSNRILRALVALALLYAGLQFIGSTLVPPVYAVSTDRELPANLEDSWEVLTDFSAYPQWNPYLTTIEGEFEVGEVITLTLVTPNSPESRQSRPQLAEIEPLKQFSWEGRFPVPGIAHTRHVFALEKIDGKRTRLLHYEEFRGLAVALMQSGREAESQSNTQAFTDMNNALSLRLEKRDRFDR
jgi:hypothetical protein